MKLVTRVTLATAAAAAVAALVAALGSWAIAHRLIDDGEDRRLVENARVTLHELPRDADEASFAKAVAGEQEELTPASIRIAVRRGSRFAGGDLDLPRPPAATCESHARGDVVLRACAVADGEIVVVAAAARATRAPSAFLLGCVLASAFAALVAAVAAGSAAKWALAPLTKLRASLDHMRAESPDASSLPEDGGATEVAELRAALAGLVGRLAESLGRARRFSADAAHELRTPLTALTAELDLLAEEPLQPRERDAVARLRERTAALSRLVERLLVLATTGAELEEGDAVALEDVVREVVASLPASQLSRVGLSIAGEGMVRGDPTLLAVLVENAVDNALKFSGVRPIELRLAEASGDIVLDVEDQGPGIGPNDRARVFEPFFRSSGTRASGAAGHGIGLALVDHIARAHRGSAAFLDGKGAILRVKLPAWRPAE